ncbi:sigma-70 family RNA polymerase sigma factor [bacterium]|nr:sigma-70 family RNA polymerase sigma factor [bacterium]
MSADRSSRRYVTIEEVYRRYGTDLLRFLHGANPHLNHQDSEDLLQQAVLRAVSRIDQYDPARGSLRLWVFGILRNELRQDLRRRRRQEGPVPAELSGFASAEPPVFASVVSSEQVAAIEDALAGLPFAERETLLMEQRTEGAATTEQIAERLGIAPGSVAVYRQRARERLREALRRKGFASAVIDGRAGDGGGAWRKTPFRTRTGS